jgi:hypothetical protein
MPYYMLVFTLNCVLQLQRAVQSNGAQQHNTHTHTSYCYGLAAMEQLVC